VWGGTSCWISNEGCAQSVELEDGKEKQVADDDSFIQTSKKEKELKNTNAIAPRRSLEFLKEFSPPETGLRKQESKEAAFK